VGRDVGVVSVRFFASLSCFQTAYPQDAAAHCDDLKHMSIRPIHGQGRPPPLARLAELITMHVMVDRPREDEEGELPCLE
jgi:hypothetical protein